MLGTTCIIQEFTLNNHHNSINFLRLITQTLICNKTNLIMYNNPCTNLKQQEYWTNTCPIRCQLQSILMKTSSRTCSKITENSTLNLSMSPTYLSFILLNSREGTIVRKSLWIKLEGTTSSLWFRTEIIYLLLRCSTRFFNNTLRE